MSSAVTLSRLSRLSLNRTSRKERVTKKYYCENCGKEVEESDDLCRHCGAIFVAIKCPLCGFRGKKHHFRNGCPVCGFLDNHYHHEKSGEPKAEAIPEDSPGERTVKRTRYASSKAPMPEWLFWVVMGVFVAAFVVLALIYMRL